MSIGTNAIFRFDINNFKWLWVYFIVSFSRRINLCDATQNTEKHHLYSLLSATYLMDKYQIFSAYFLAKNAYPNKNSLQVFFKKIRKYNLAAGDGLAKTWRFFPPT
jgi:hypothetical protein